MTHLNAIKKATIITTTTLIAATSIQPPSALAGNGENCENGRSLGQFVIQSKLNDKYLSTNREGILKAKLSTKPAQGSKGVFEIFDVSNLPGATKNTFALRSVKNPNQWWRVKNNQETVKLDSYQCKSGRKSTTFIAAGYGGSIALKSRKNDQWIKVNRDDRLKASVGNPNGREKTVFLLTQVTQPGQAQPDPQPNPQPNPQPQPAPQVNLNGWLKGNNKGVYSAQRSGNNFQMKGFLNGKPFNLITGTIQGNIINASWKNYCNNSTGSLKLRIERNRLVKVGGNPGFNTSWTPTQKPASISSRPDCNPQPQVNLNGWLKGNNKGVYSAQRSGNNFQMKGFLNGKPFNLITGTIQGNIINASWKNYCNNSTGSLKLRIERNRLVKVGGNPGFNTSWTPTQKPASISSRPDCNPQPQVNLNGWLKGNNKGVYSAQRSGNNFQMKGFLNGKPFNLITGTIQGNIINASWKNYCNNSTGNLKLRIERNRLVKVGGNPGFNTSWTPTQKPASISSRPDCNPQPQVNLNGWLKGNNKGVYSAQRSGNNFQMKGFLNGKPFNLITGTIQGNIINASWKNYCNNSTGSLKLRIERNRLVKVGGNPGFNTSWTPTQKPASISSRPAC